MVVGWEAPEHGLATQCQRQLWHVGGGHEGFRVRGGAQERGAWVENCARMLLKHFSQAMYTCWGAI